MPSEREQTGAATVTDAELLSTYRSLLDTKDERAAALTETNKMIAGIERQLLERFEASGLDSMKGAGITVWTKPQAVVDCDAEHWTDILQWATETGNVHLIQKRLTAKSVIEALDNGGLPAGLIVKWIPNVEFRRAS